MRIPAAIFPRPNPWSRRAASSRRVRPPPHAAHFRRRHPLTSVHRAHAHASQAPSLRVSHSSSSSHADRRPSTALSSGDYPPHPHGGGGGGGAHSGHTQARMHAPLPSDAPLN